MKEKPDNIVEFNKREKVSEDAMCGYCHLFIDNKCILGHKSVSARENCKDLVKID